jgi:hypothetical protein
MRTLLDTTLFISAFFLALFVTSCSESEVKYVYYSNGNIKQSIQTTEGSKKIRKYFYESSKLKSEQQLEGGKLNGISKFYYENGKVYQESFHKNDTLQGIMKTYFPSGQLRSVIDFKDDKPIKDMLFFYENGKIREHQIYNLLHQLIFMTKYDGKGKKIERLVRPIIHSNDTVKKGQYYSVTVTFGYNLRGDAKLIIGKIDDSTNIINATEIIPMVDNGFKYRIYCEKKGNYTFNAIIKHNVQNNDSLTANGIILKQKYRVV